jgi:CheY-like chemotaxis protein
MSVLILVVDDEVDMEELFRQQFRRDLKAGRFLMAFATSGPAALTAISTSPAPDLILLLSDINMPGMSGLELLPRVKALHPDVPVVMITAYGDAETRARAVEGGADGVMSKPIDFGELRADIERRLAERGIAA